MARAFGLISLVLLAACGVDGAPLAPDGSKVEEAETPILLEEQKGYF